jgi:hypothetical protein
LRVAQLQPARKPRPSCACPTLCNQAGTDLSDAKAAKADAGKIDMLARIRQAAGTRLAVAKAVQDLTEEYEDLLLELAGAPRR